MKKSAVSCRFSEFLLTTGAGLSARNSGATEFNQAAAHLAHRVFAGVPRPVEGGQGDRQDPGRKELQQHMSDTQEQGPAAHALARTALIVPEPQLFNLVEIDLNLEAPCI